MSITDLIELGQTGEDIIELLDDVRDAVNQPEDFNDDQGEFDHDHQMEYVDTTISMIENLLTKLKSKC